MAVRIAELPLLRRPEHLSHRLGPAFSEVALHFDLVDDIAVLHLDEEQPDASVVVPENGTVDRLEVEKRLLLLLHERTERTLRKREEDMLLGGIAHRIPALDLVDFWCPEVPLAERVVLVQGKSALGPADVRRPVLEVRRRHHRNAVGRARPVGVVRPAVVENERISQRHRLGKRERGQKAADRRHSPKPPKNTPSAGSVPIIPIIHWPHFLLLIMFITPFVIILP